MHGIPLAGLITVVSFIVSWKSSGRKRSKDRNKWQSTTSASIYMYIKLSMYNKEGKASKTLTMASALPMQVLGPTANGWYEYGLGLHHAWEGGTLHIAAFIQILYTYMYMYPLSLIEGCSILSLFELYNIL